MSEAIDFGAWVTRLHARQKAIGLQEPPAPLSEPKRVEGVLGSMGVPKRARNTLQSLQETSLIRRVREWAQSDAWALVLASRPGVGKSVAAAAWLRSVVDRDMQPSDQLVHRWWPATELAAANSYGKEDQIADVCRVRHLVIDDLGVEMQDKSGAFNSKLDRILDARYRDMRKTIITTNLNPQAFVERYGERIRDRMREGGSWYEPAGESRRGAK